MVEVPNLQLHKGQRLLVSPTYADDEIASARLAEVMLHFSQERLLPAVRWIPTLNGQLGDVAVKFFPEGVLIPRTEVVQYLLEQPKPIAVASMSARGLFARWTPSMTDPAARQELENGIYVARRTLDAILLELGLGEESRLVLQAGGQRHVFPVRIFRRCILDYQIFVAWTIKPLSATAVADARLFLVRADGTSDSDNPTTLPP